MMAAINSITLTLGYSNTDFTRKYKFTGMDSSAFTSVKAKVQAYNAAIPAADKKIFISDDYDDTDSENIIGEFAGIVAAQYESVEETNIPLFDEGGE